MNPFNGQTKVEESIGLVFGQTNDDPNIEIKDIDLAALTYIPLPQAPATWESKKVKSLRDDPKYSSIYKQYWAGNHKKAIELFKSAAAPDYESDIEETVSKAYRCLIAELAGKGRYIDSANLSIEMQNGFDDLFTDSDKRKFNTIVAKIKKIDPKSSFEKLPVPKAQRSEKFQILGNSTHSLSDPIPASKYIDHIKRFDVARIDTKSTLFFSRYGIEFTANPLSYLSKVTNDENPEISENCLNHETRTFSAKPGKGSFASLDRSGILYVFNDNLALVAEVDLKNHKKVIDHFKLKTSNYWGDLDSQIRSIDATTKGEYFIFSLADEVWCCNSSGTPIWGIRSPLNEGWERSYAKTNSASTDRKVAEALKTLELKLPVSPEEIKSKYHQLAKKNHPDQNTDKENAHEETIKIINAFKTLTGLDPSQLENSESTIATFRRKQPDKVIEGVHYRLELTFSNGKAQDWIYCSALKFTGIGAYIGTYSGKVFEINDTGDAVLAYDIGQPPNNIFDTSEFLYIQTYTRLYVIQKPNILARMIDIKDFGKFFFADNSLLYLSEKTFSLHSESGENLCKITSTLPIKSIRRINDVWEISTRQYRTILTKLV